MVPRKLIWSPWNTPNVQQGRQTCGHCGRRPHEALRHSGRSCPNWNSEMLSEILHFGWVRWKCGPPLVDRVHLPKWTYLVDPNCGPSTKLYLRTFYNFRRSITFVACIQQLSYYLYTLYPGIITLYLSLWLEHAWVTPCSPYTSGPYVALILIGIK